MNLTYKKITQCATELHKPLRLMNTPPLYLIYLRWDNYDLRSKYEQSIIGNTVGVFAVSLTTSAMAGVRDPNINRHQRHQAERIGQGVKSGELTKGETKDLVKDQREIRREERQYKSDGKFTKDERKDVREDQRDASKEIHEEKHDDQVRP